MSEPRVSENGREFRVHGGPATQLELRERDGGGKMLTGYAAVFYDGRDETEYELWPGVVERVDKKAFKAALKRDDVRALFNHNPSQLLGRSKSKTLRLSTDATGLRYEIDLDDTDIAGDVLRMVERGDLSGSSFGFRAKAVKWSMTEDKKTEIRTLLDVELFDVGPVTFPAYHGTTVAKRCVDELGELRAERSRRLEIAKRAGDLLRAEQRARINERAAAIEKTLAAAGAAG